MFVILKSEENFELESRKCEENIREILKTKK